MEKQLMYDNNNDIITEVPIAYYKTFDEIPDNIKKFITNKTNEKYIYDYQNDICYCPKCLNKIKDYKCNNCNREFKKNFYFSKGINDCFDFYFGNTSYYFFDVVDDNVLLYIVQELIEKNQFNVPNIYYKIYRAFDVREDKIIDLKNNKIYYYKDYVSKVDDEETFDEDYFETFIVESLSSQYLYVDNLDILKNNKLYKYSYIWNLKDIINDKEFSVATLTIFPIYYKQFEYLVKMKLYSLAFNYPYKFTYNKNFKEVFEVDKKYYKFMKDNDIYYSDLEALQLYPCEDIELIKWISRFHDIFAVMPKEIDFMKLKEYFNKNNLLEDNIYEYLDYIDCCIKLELNLNDKNIIYPENFHESHDRLTAEKLITYDKDIDNKITCLSDILSLNIYEDDKYIIFPASSISSLLDESNQMSNCVRTYCDKYSNGECQIYFMREKNSVNKSLVTIEVKNNKVVQARIKYNKLPDKDIMKIINKWEKTLTPIYINN